MYSNALYRVILDQRDELPSLVEDSFIDRPEADLISLDSKLAQVVIGVRRSGKSTLCHTALRKSGLPYAYVNFDDDRLATLSVTDLNNVLESVYRVYGADVKYIFLDEIQNVDGWHLFVNRLLRQGLHIIVTGSNAKLLSSELTTHLTGRYHEIRLYPFSFSEYCKIKNIDTSTPTTRNIAMLKNALDNYLMEGGFPEIFSLPDRYGYVGSLIDAIITKDIMTRFHIRNGSGLKTLANHLINNIGQPINMSELVDTFKIGTDKTVRNYVNYLTQAFLIVPLTKFSYKSSERLRNSKAYAVDTGMLTYRNEVLSAENLGWRLENVVLLELLRRCVPQMKDIFYYRPDSRSKEVDFVVTNRGRVEELIQVSYDISNTKTLSRELTALVEASRKIGCDKLTLVALSDRRKETLSGLEIHVEPVVEWLLGY